MRTKKQKKLETIAQVTFFMATTMLCVAATVLIHVGSGQELCPGKELGSLIFLCTFMCPLVGAVLTCFFSI